MKKVLITGGAGFIGSYLTVKLHNLGYHVTVLDNLSPQIHGINPDESYTYNLIKGKSKIIVGDVTKVADLEKALAGIEYIIHLAAETGTGQSMYEINRYIDTNIVGTSKILEILASHKFNIKKLIVASSRAVYGEGKYKCRNDGFVYPDSRLEADLRCSDFNVKCPICGENVEMEITDEDSKLHPTSVYGFTKQAQEQLCLMIGKSIGLPVVAFRFQNVYGVGQSLKNPYTGILSIFSTRIMNENEIHVFEDGEESRDFVNVSDVTDAIILGLEKDSANGKVFNVGSGQQMSVKNVAAILKEQYESDVNIKITSNYRVGDIRHNVADLKYIKECLGYSPKISFYEGIASFTKWVKSQKIENDLYDDSIKEMKQKGLLK